MRNPHAIRRAVGMEAHGATIYAIYDRAKQVVRPVTDRSTAAADYCCVSDKSVTAAEARILNPEQHEFALSLLALDAGLCGRRYMWFRYRIGPR